MRHRSNTTNCHVIEGKTTDYIIIARRFVRKMVVLTEKLSFFRYPSIIVKFIRNRFTDRPLFANGFSVTTGEQSRPRQTNQPNANTVGIASYAKLVQILTFGSFVGNG